MTMLHFDIVWQIGQAREIVSYDVDPTAFDMTVDEYRMNVILTGRAHGCEPVECPDSTPLQIFTPSPSRKQIN